MKHVLQLLTIGTLTIAMTMVSSCTKEQIAPASNDDAQADYSPDYKGKKGGNGNGGGKKNRDDSSMDTGTVDTVTYAYTYAMRSYDDKDALYKFKISTSGDLMLLRTDSTVTHWGEDKWGYWADPFEYKNGQVIIQGGMSITTYSFTQRSDGTLDVYKELIIQRSYLDPTSLDTTYSHPGIYALE